MGLSPRDLEQFREYFIVVKDQLLRPSEYDRSSSVWTGNLTVQPIKGLRIGFAPLGRSMHRSIADGEFDCLAESRSLPRKFRKARVRNPVGI